ncbi:NAD(+) diphosphatase [Marinobacter sp. 2_MG-2023]|uniref:NAD(+) diphosphatase n=1 Tax=Marinobacter sp. 2_MG-2023 TaxID=3062679 RepID=UPI0026E230B3|nr:NAD(+) diphosphatase [Marinobacter sp. 2_MG-2023]MDO6441066.1 NAD(+) diphosphatase [Marinobacter sp. 2_MG-2023]
MATSTIQWSPGWTTQGPEQGDLVLALSGSGVFKPKGDWLQPLESLPANPRNAGFISLGNVDGRPVFVTEVPEPLIAGHDIVPLRDALLMISDVPAAMLSTGFQVWQWFQDHQYCGRCGSRTGFHPRERARWCSSCNIPWYPRLAPCVIVVIRNKDRYLLAKSSRGKRNFYSLIAGFVEPGESLEGAVVREVKEETGLDVTNIQYQASQPWPFPHQLMAGFFADYAGGELILQEDELADAGWFLPGSRPPIPPDTTISGRLIRDMERVIAGGGVER